VGEGRHGKLKYRAPPWPRRDSIGHPGENRVHETAARFLRFLLAANITASTAVDILRIAMPRSKLDQLKRREADR
jgi:hypothetical protein